MAERAKRNLPYGHFGQVAYSLEDEEWSFERVSTPPQIVRSCGPPNHVYQPSDREQLKNVPVRAEPQGQRMRRQTKDLLEHVPELQPAAGLLTELLRVSEATQEAVLNHDSTTGRLIATSSIRSEIQHKSMRIAALACGESRTELRLIHVQNRRRGLSHNHKSWVAVPTLYGEETVCTKFDGPVQQVVFAEPVDRGEPLLGVRLLTKTLIFRPTHGTRKSAEQEVSSNIQPNLMYDVDIKSTGNLAHADVAFNPWFSQQIALVDQSGSWTVMEFQSRKLSRVARTWTGAVKASSLSDGWARIAWLFNLEIIAVCTRDTITLISIAGQNSARLHTVAPDIASGPPWILDFAVLPGQMDKFAVLTTNNLLVYRVASSGSHGVQVENIATIEHFRNPEATDMRMSIWCFDEGVNVLLYPRTGGVATLYGLNTSAQATFHIIDPIEVRLKRHSTSSTIVDMHVTPITSSGGGILNEEQGQTEFFLATIVLSDDTVLERIFYRSRRNAVKQEYVTTWETKLNATGAKVKQIGFAGAIEGDSVVHDEHVQERPVSRRARRIAPRREPEDRGIDLSRVAKDFDVHQEFISVAHVVGEAKSAFRTEEDTILPMRTLDSFQDTESISVANPGAGESLDEVQYLLSESIHVRDSSDDAFTPEQRLRISPIMARLPIDFPPELHAHSLPEMYNAIMSCWLAGLADDVPGRVRLAKAAVARHVTTQLALASRVAHADEGEPQASARGREEQYSGTAALSRLPIRAPLSANREGSAQPMDLAGSSQFSTLPTPSPTATPSVVTMSTGLSSFAAPEIFRLCKYTTFSKPSPSVLSRPMSKILSHWNVGDSPAEYDWQSTSKHVQRDDEDEDDAEEMSERDRKRLQRRAERHIKRQRREAAASQAQQMASSQAPEILTASQPAAMVTESQPMVMSSQPSAPRVAVASQVVPGRFGGRPAKKKRKSGF
ncbi:hypothetical protein CB0940_00992 [Cercospora beticola]|uniref:RNA polymerase I-specific transcription initiation factor RRN6 n=1 Tax=Cercospora beticola TaxID=122368 RepID=A0A2G5IDP0_CERBT|nr:hypothetical protein CB0940_00992 [Cercospora beticola]PIB02634.1 hypothetical protein CB0940_00992 [Cercospora beticola]WPA96416.1 hypothetical protein RHO25_001023 [Cercospora beticola]CAK1355265.1 unnamed protein product [Cercospora beticola]